MTHKTRKVLKEFFFYLYKPMSITYLTFANYLSKNYTYKFKYLEKKYKLWDGKYFNEFSNKLKDSYKQNINKILMYWNYFLLYNAYK